MWKPITTAFVAIAILCGYPYSGWLMSRALGTSTVTMTEYDGTLRTLVSGPSADRPDWVPLMPDSLLVTAANWVPTDVQREEGDTAYLSHADTDNIADFYTRVLAPRGFTVAGPVIAGLSPQAAGLVGIEGVLVARNAQSGEELTIQISSPSGLILRPRLVQIHWRRG